MVAVQTLTPRELSPGPAVLPAELAAGAPAAFL